MTIDEQIAFMRRLGQHFIDQYFAHEGARALQEQDQANADACAHVVKTLVAERERQEAVGADWA